MNLAALVLLALQQPGAGETRPFALMVGDPAPALEVKEWVQGGPIERLEPGQIHVVEFWATWCGPCRVAIPHLNELSQRYRDRVRFVGVSVWEHLDRGPYSVPEFVKSMGDKMTYAVAADRTQESDPARMAKSWMEAAGQRGIPAAFIVNAEGRIAWIGHPMRIDSALEAIVAGKWDLGAEAAKYAEEKRLEGVVNGLKQEIGKARKSGDLAAAVAAIDTALAKHPSLESSFGLERYFLLLEARRSSEAQTYGLRLVSDVYPQDAGALNQLSWRIIDPEAKVPDPDLKVAVLAAERAAVLTEQKDPNVLDTLGLALFKSGDVARAVEVQEQAVGLAKGTPNESELKKRLEEFRAKRAPKSGV